MRQGVGQDNEARSGTVSGAGSRELSRIARQVVGTE